MKWSWKDFLEVMMTKRKKSLALKALTSFDDDEDELESLEDLEDEKELALLSKKYKKILRSRKGANR